MGFSPEARKSAALARKIKARLGPAAYTEFKRTGQVPPGLDEARPSSAIKTAVKHIPTAPGRLPSAPKRTPGDLKIAELAAKLHPLSEPRTIQAFAPRRLPVSQTTPIAREQARNAMPDSKLIAHYKDSGIFNRRGLGPNEVRKIRDDWYRGNPVPLWSVPPNTDVAVYRSHDICST